MRLPRAPFPAFLLLLLAAPIARAAGPRLVAQLPSIQANDEQHWSVPFILQNDLETGLYPDSLWCEAEDQGPGRTGAARTRIVPLQQLVRIIGNVSAGESTYFQYEGSTLFEQGRLTFHLLAHDATGGSHALSAAVEVGPGPVATRFPSRFLSVGGHRVETVFVPAREDSGITAAPGLLLIPGEGSHARSLIAEARMLAHRGYAVMLVSLPGYGLSEGDPDFAGPASVKAAAAALDALRRGAGVDPARLAAWGVSRSVAVALALAAGATDLRAVVAESGAYDLWAVQRGTASAGLREAIGAEAGRDSAAWRERSPAAAAAVPHAAVLLLHGGLDTEFPAGQAEAFAAALQARGVKVDTHLIPKGAHVLPRGELYRAAFLFLDREMHP